MIPVSLLQLPLVHHLPDPPWPQFSSDKANLSPDAYRFIIPDGVLVLLSSHRATLLDLLLWRMTRALWGVGDWPEWMDDPPKAPPPRIEGNRLHVTFINHATVLIQTGGVNLLTDPIWSERTGPIPLVGPRRHRPPGLHLKDLPRIDAVLLTHDYYDHLDIPTLRILAADHRPAMLAGLGNGPLLAKNSISNVQELDWWQAAELSGGLRVTSVPAQPFFGARAPRS